MTHPGGPVGSAEPTEPTGEGGGFAHEFELDAFQRDAIAALDAGRNVLVAAPTGAGKTVVAEHAVDLALRDGRRCFYTAPIKALSNQKFADLRRVLGEDQVGLLTGDHSIAADAPVVVMTTEVLRNMIYARSGSLDRLGWVVLDEVHFLQDAYRGPVWEEVLIHTPPGVGFVCLSATVSNAAELGAWITELRGPTDTVVEHERPIRLDPLLLVGDRSAEREHLVPLLVDGRANPEGHRFDADPPARRGGPPSRGPRGGRSRFRTPRRVEVVDRLDDEELLPSIYFIFSRNACDDAARACLDGGVRLTDGVQRRRIRAIAEHRTAALGEEDLGVLGYDSWLATLEQGIGSHHAGMVPAFRETVEECFNEGLLGAVFATETLALGINMPARSVVIERLSKFNGERHEFLSPGQFTQLTGRAGRRGIDEAGSAVVLWSPFVTFDQVASLAASREFPLSSSFRPTYNMTANLVERYDRAEAGQVLRRSFAQFQADRAVVRLESRRDRLAGELAALRDTQPDSVSARALDVEGYDRLRREQRRAADRQRSPDARAEVARSLAALRPGDVVERPTKRGIRRLVVLAVSQRRGGGVRVRATGVGGHLVRLDAATAGAVLRPATRVELERPPRPQDPSYRRSAAKLLRRAESDLDDAAAAQHDSGSAVDSDPGTDLRRRIEEHPLHHHPDRQRLLDARARVGRLEADLEQLERETRRRGSVLVQQFEAVLAVLDETDHLDGWELTDAGARLRRIYHEADLLVSLALRDGLFDGLTDAEIAAMASCLTHEHRSSEPPPPPSLPTSELRPRFERLVGLRDGLARLERRHRLPETREPSAGFATAAWGWADGQHLHVVLDEDLTGGDFVRNVRTLIDLLRQLGDLAAEPNTRASARRAADSLARGAILGTGAFG